MATLLLAWTATTVFAGDGGNPDKYKDVPQDVRNWFKGVKSHLGIPCCDIADGYRVDAEKRSDNHFWVYIADKWRQVPESALVQCEPTTICNPTGDAVVWIFDNGVTSPDESRYFIRCFVPGPEQ